MPCNITASKLITDLQALRAHADRDQVFIHTDNIEHQKRSYFQVFISIFSSHYHEESVRNLKEIIGERRLERIFLRRELGLDVKALRNNRVLITKEVLKKVLIGLGDVRLDDLQERATAQGKTLDALTTEQMHTLYSELLPISDISHIYLGKMPVIPYFDKADGSGKGYNGLKERVWIINHHRILLSQDSIHEADRFHSTVETLSSRFVEREPPEGTVFFTDGHYRVVDRVFARSGAYVTVAKSVTEQTSAYIICRGTATRVFSATSALMTLINDILPELGWWGIRSIWDDMQNYLHQQNIQNVKVVGKSLGGAHAQYLTPLIGGLTNAKVTCLGTNCATGVPPTVQEVYNTVFAAEHPEGVIVRNSGNRRKRKEQIDYVPYVGGPHLIGNNTKVVYLGPSDEDLDQLPKPEGFVSKVFALLDSFQSSHRRQTTIHGVFKSVIISENVHEEAKVGEELEDLRKIFAAIFNVLTVGYFSRESFKEFYEARHRLRIAASQERA